MNDYRAVYEYQSDNPDTDEDERKYRRMFQAGLEMREYKGELEDA